MAEMKHRIVHTLQKYLLNPPIKLLFAVGVAAPGYALLETTGRTTGKPRQTPVGAARIGSQFWLVAEHGMKAGCVRNIASQSARAGEVTYGARGSVAHRHGACALGR
jgi:F420H(2)-dependent quinone reductase